MRLEIYRIDPSGDEVRTVARWTPSDKLAQWISRYIALLEHRGMPEFMPSRAVVLGPRGGVHERWAA
jgi:hypothetical protein